jgi:inner membrane protein
MDYMENMKGSVKNVINKSYFLKILYIGLLVLILQIPVSMIQSTIWERQTTRDSAVKEVMVKWGSQQSLAGPFLIVPFVERWTARNSENKPVAHSRISHAVFLPENLQIAGEMDSSVRHRGIFEVPVYSVSLDVKGDFLRPDFSSWGIDEKDILWERAQVSVELSDVQSITNNVKLIWNEEELSFSPGAGDFREGVSGVHVTLGDKIVGEAFSFSMALEANGSIGAFFAPLGKETRIELTSDWKDPSFQGGWLPSNHEIDDSGFKANWEIPFLGRNYPQKWKADSWKTIDTAIEASKSGFELLAVVDHYRMSIRSVKYEVLFLVLTFATLWLFEIIAGAKVHAIQYLLVGAGMCLFYLLELSLAEHLGFMLAYILASAAITLLISTYCIAVLKKGGRAAIVASVMVGLYGFLYVLLQLQDYALLLGSIGLFVILAIIMFLTRKIDWYGTKDA